jgi:hypothetical protein
VHRPAEAGAVARAHARGRTCAHAGIRARAALPSLSWDNLIQSRTRTSPEARPPPPGVCAYERVAAYGLCVPAHSACGLCARACAAANKLKALEALPAFGTAQWQAMMFARGCPYENGTLCAIAPVAVRTEAVAGCRSHPPSVATRCACV